MASPTPPQGATPAPAPQRRPQRRPQGGLMGTEMQLVEERLLELQFGLLSLDDDEAEGGGGGEGLLAECAAWFQPQHLAAVVEELASSGQCGYPACRRALGAEQLAARAGQVKIDAKHKRIVEVTRETNMFCSDSCLESARRFASGLSTEAPIFRPTPRAYVRARRQEQAATKGPSLVYELVKKAHGAADASPSASPAKEEREQEQEEKGKAERLPIRPKLRQRAGSPQSSSTQPAAEKGAETAAAKGGAAGKPPKAPGASADKGKGKERGGGGPLKMEVLERTAPEAPQPLSAWVVKGAEIEGHVVGIVGRPSHQPVSDLLAEMNTTGGEGWEEEEGEEVVVEGATAVGEEEVLPGAGITTEDELGWAPSTEIDLSSVPSVVDTDVFMQVWTSVSDWLTPDAREYVRRVATGPKEEEEKEGVVLADLLARPDATARRKLLDALKREAALGQILAPFLPPAMDALRPLLVSQPARASSFTAGRVTARVQGLLVTLDLARPLPAFLSSKHYEALALLFIDAAVAGGAAGAALQASQGEGGEAVRCWSMRQALQRAGLSSAEYRCVLGDFGLPEGGGGGQQ